MIPALVPLAISVASKFIPDLVGKVFESDKAESIATAVVGAAKVATGLKDPEEALAAFKPNDEQRTALREQVLSLIDMQIKDVQHARENNHYTDLTAKLSWTVMVGNLLVISLLIGGLVWLATAELTSGINTTLSAMIGGALNQMYQERQQVMNYLFGSAVGSKLKDLLKK